MTPYPDPQIPLVVVANLAEPHLGFIARATDPVERQALLDAEERNAERALLWLRDEKLVIVGKPIAHATALLAHLGNRATGVVSPVACTHRLSADVAADPALLTQIIQFAGLARRIQLVPHATTREFFALADALRDRGLTVDLPESPKPADLWLSDVVNTKSGFHQLAAHMLGSDSAALVESCSCASLAVAEEAVARFHARGQDCVVKPDASESGIGELIVRREHYATPKQVHDFLVQSPYWGEEPIIVEPYIDSPEFVFPSVELFVPRVDQGPPAVTFVSDQVFKQPGEFCGVLLSPTLRTEPWFKVLCEQSLGLANGLQEMGFVGHFAIETVVDAAGSARMLELHAQRSSGTHVHEFAMNRFGLDYLDRLSVLSQDAVDSYGIRDHVELFAALKGLLYPMGGEERGIFVTGMGALSMGKYGMGAFGAILVAETPDQLFALRAEMMARVQPQA